MTTTNEITIRVSTKDDTAAGMEAARARAQKLRQEFRDLDGKTVEPKVELAGAAKADEEVRRVSSRLREVDGKTAHSDIDVDVSGAMHKIAMLAASVAAVGAGGLALPLAALGGAGVGAAVAGLSGVGDAVKALGDQTKGAGAAAEQTASRQLALAGAVDRVRSAQASLRNTQQQAADAERRALEQVTVAQQDLTRARADAARQIRDLARQQEDLARQSEDMALAQKGALLDIEQAQADLDKVMSDPHATDLQRRQAQLAFDEAVQHNKDLKTQAADLQQQVKDNAAAKDAADRKGVAGSDQVRNATRRLRDAETAAAQERRQAAFQVAQAQQQVVDAQRAVQAASLSAGAVGVASMDKLRDSMNNLSPAGQSFARFLRGFIDGPLKALRTATQQGLLPGLQKGLEGLGPIIQKNLPDIQHFSDTLGRALGGIIEVAGRLFEPLTRFADRALERLSPLKGVFDRFADSFAQMLDKMSKDGTLDELMDGIVKTFKALLEALPKLLPPLSELASALLPVLAAAIEKLAPPLARMIDGVAKLVKWLTTYFPEGVRAIEGWLKTLGRWFGDIGRAVKGVYDNVTHWFGDAAKFVADTAKTVVRWFNDIAGAAHAIGHWVNEAAKAIKHFMDLASTGVSSSFNFFGGLPGLPFPHAAGGPTSGGLSRINEQGGEIVKLPTGSMVYPAGQSSRMLGAAGQQIHVVLSVAPGGSQGLIAAVLEQLRYEVRVAGGIVQNVLGTG